MRQADNTLHTSKLSRDPILDAIDLHVESRAKLEKTDSEKDEGDFLRGMTAELAASQLVLNTIPTTYAGVITLCNWLGKYAASSHSVFDYVQFQNGSVTAVEQTFQLIADCLECFGPEDFGRYEAENLKIQQQREAEETEKARQQAQQEIAAKRTAKRPVKSGNGNARGSGHLPAAAE
jgi:hypothetical protein